MKPPAKVITIFSTKGGVGTTLIAANLAATLRIQLNKKTTLLELAPSAKDAVTMLGSTDVRCVSESVTIESLPSVLASLRSTADYVFIDAGSVFSELVVNIFELSNLILLVTTPDVLSILHVNQTIEWLERLKVPLRMVKVVINRADSRGNLRSSEIREQFPVGVIAEIPSDGRAVGLSVNQSLPLVISPDGGRVKESLKRLGRLFAESPELFVEEVTIERIPLPAVPESMVTDSRGLVQEEAAARARLHADDPLVALKQRVHSRLIEKFDLKRLDMKTLNDPLRAQQLKAQAERIALDLIAEEAGMVKGREERGRLVKEIVDEAMGLGPLEDLMADETVSDILVNGMDLIYVEKRGKLHLTEKRFTSNAQLLTVIERIIAPLGRRIDESNPMVDARLPDGSRVNAIIPPLSLKGPMLSIRKFARERYTMDDLLAFGTLSPGMAEFLSLCVQARKNMIVSGGTGSGKTTVLNVLSAFIPKGERIVTIEDAAELRLSQEHWVPLESRPPNIEGKGTITMRQLFRNALRMRPDRIVIGECRGDETMDMLQAMNTGHDGSLTTLHANSPQDVISRLDSLILMSNVDLPVRAIREQIASAIHLIVHTARLSDGSRKITHITEITGIGEHSDLVFRDLFLFHQQGVTSTGDVRGYFAPSGQLPSFFTELKARGIPVDERMFHPQAAPPTPVLPLTPQDSRRGS